ncbi:hypothetical protein ACFC1R_30135 [Kitasatospora sp. NPDC056138]|uniref:hypothetical protein n=1 Tax=Kitasatospora sp. NPDC056138 TaxID=3345724 RepID=UPI0035DE0FDC
MRMRTLVVVAAGNAAVLAATSITYASTAGSTPASPPVQRAAQPVQPATLAVATSGGGSASGEKAQGRDREGGGSASGERDEGRDREGGGRASGERDEGRDREGGGRGYGHKEEGRIYFNEREYPAAVEGCISAASGLGASSFSIFNDSRKTVEVFRGFACDNGAPVAVVGPYGETDGVVTRTVHGGLFGGDGVAGSFRVIGDWDEW